jgi:hypothetical protein
LGSWLAGTIASIAKPDRISAASKLQMKFPAAPPKSGQAVARLEPPNDGFNKSLCRDPGDPPGSSGMVASAPETRRARLLDPFQPFV